MARYTFKSGLKKIGRVIRSGRGLDYLRRIGSVVRDIYHDYSNPEMGKISDRMYRGVKKSTPSMGKKRRGKKRR